MNLSPPSCIAASPRRRTFTARIRRDYGEILSFSLGSIGSKSRLRQLRADLYGGNLTGVLDFLEMSRQARIRDLAEVEFERRWVAVSAPAGLTVGIFLALFAYSKLSAFTRTNPYLDFVLLTLPGALILGFSVLLNRYGKQVLHRMTIERIVKRLSTAPKSTAPTAASMVGSESEFQLPDAFAAYGWRLLGCSIDAHIFFLFLGISQVLVEQSLLSDTLAVYLICLPAYFLLSRADHAVKTSGHPRYEGRQDLRNRPDRQRYLMEAGYDPTFRTASHHI